MVVRAGREGSVQGNRPTGGWALGRGWTGGTGPEGALGLQGFQRWGVAKGGSSVEPAGLSPAESHVREGGAGGTWTREGPVGAPGLSVPREVGGGHWGPPRGRGADRADGRGEVGGCRLAWSQGSRQV